MPPPLAGPSGITLGKCVGRGQYGEVFHATVNGSGDAVAVKRIDRSLLSPSRTEALLSEIESLKGLRHPHIVALLDIQHNRQSVFLVLQYCNGRDFSVYLRESGPLSEPLVWPLFGQLVDGLRFLQHHQLIHRDLKPANILLDYPGGAPAAGVVPVLLIADFGFAGHAKPHERLVGMLGTPLYMAPEILTMGEYDSRVDLWSLGIILHEMIFGRTPFHSRTMAELVAKLSSTEEIDIQQTHAGISPELYTILFGLLRRTPDERLTLEQLCASPYIRPYLTPLQRRRTPPRRAAVPAPTVKPPATPPRLSADASLRAGAEHAQRAVASDQKADYADAQKHYELAASFLLSAIRSDPSSPHAKAARERCDAYVSRAEQLKRAREARPARAGPPQPLRRTPSGNEERPQNDSSSVIGASHANYYLF